MAKDYQAFDHGYATTIHKAQGATVDRSFVMASATMDRHLTYVAMTRHRHQARLYAVRDEFEDMKALTASMSRSGLKEPPGENIRQQQPMRQTSLQQTVKGQRQGRTSLVTTGTENRRCTTPDRLQRLSGTPPEAGYGIWKTSTARKHGNGKSGISSRSPLSHGAARKSSHASKRSLMIKGQRSSARWRTQRKAGRHRKKSTQ